MPLNAAVSKSNTGAFMFSGIYAEITAKNGERYFMQGGFKRGEDE